MSDDAQDIPLSVSGVPPEEQPHFSAPAPEIEGYQILEKLGEAGQGQVWRAIQLSTQRQVALKVPRIGLLSSRKTLARFEREVNLAARLKHPHIVRILDSGVRRGLYYYAIDLVEGVHLDQYIRQNAFSQRQILEMVRAICDAVQHAHDHGVVHRDLKPSNILVTPAGHPYIVDFGLAKSVLEPSATATVSIDGEAAGTLAYMSPEQAAGRTDRVDARMDVYSLGAILFSLLSGQHPHDLSGSHFDVLGRISTEEVIRPRQANPQIDRDLETLLLKALEQDPDRRYESVAAMAKDIDNYLNALPLSVRSHPGLRPFVRVVRGHRMAAMGTGLVTLIVGGLCVSRMIHLSRPPTTRENSTSQVVPQTQVIRDELLAGAQGDRGAAVNRTASAGGREDTPSVNPLWLPITHIAPSASSWEDPSPHIRTVDSRGLVNDLHSTDSDAMWISRATGPTPTWIMYEFDKTYKLCELWVWDYNAESETARRCGIKDVAIEYSLDGSDWTLLKDAQFARAPGVNGYAHNTTVSLEGVMARHVRFTAKSNWSTTGLNQYGLSEVRFYHVPVRATAPRPAFNARDISINTDLDWRPGGDVASHKVYFGTDEAAVADGSAAVRTVTGHGYVPEALDFGTKYYWRVDEVGTAVYPGDVWKFVMQEYAVVDDFEGYTDKSGQAIFDAWVDGPTNGTGALGHHLTVRDGTFCETLVTHGGRQSMPFAYDNSKAPYYSEVQRTFETPQDWTVHRANTLRLYFQGVPQRDNSAAPFYLAVTDEAGKSKTVVNPDAAALNASGWTEWKIALSDLADVNIAAVKQLAIGVGNKTDPKAGAAGLLYIDDIQCGQPAMHDVTNLAVNGGFESGVLMEPWFAWGYGAATVTAGVADDCAGASVPEGPVEGRYCLHVKVSGPSANMWECAFQNQPGAFVGGTKYTLSAFFKVKTGTGRICLRPEHMESAYGDYGREVTITDKWAEYYMTTSTFGTDVSRAKWTFCIGFQAQEFWVDNVKFYEGDYVPTIVPK